MFMIPKRLVRTVVSKLRGWEASKIELLDPETLAIKPVGSVFADEVQLIEKEVQSMNDDCLGVFAIIRLDEGRIVLHSSSKSRFCE